ncbi:MAG: hypothetical protein ACI4WS_01930 [Oscillospiraceae bacterium]
MYLAKTAIQRDKKFACSVAIFLICDIIRVAFTELLKKKGISLMAEQEVFTLSRDTYKKIKAFNREQMEQFIAEIYKEAEERYSETAVDLDQLRAEIGQIKGIGENRLNEIMAVVERNMNDSE